MQPRFTVVVPTYNRKSTLRQTLIALVAQDYSDFEIIIVDDGSTDGTAEMMLQEFPGARYIRQANRGPAAARNRGVQAATGEIIAFTDDDCVPPPDWLSRLADGFARYPQVVGVGGALEAPEDVLKTNRWAQYERYVSHTVYRTGATEYLGGFECPAGGTNNLAYRRAAIVQIGGFDETFPFAAGEDTDLKLRLCQGGAQLLYVPVTALHLQDYTAAGFKRQAYFRGQGRARFDAKHGPHPSRLRSSLRLVRRELRFFTDLLNAAQRPFIVIRLQEAWYNFQGEWAMLSRLRSGRNA